METIHVFEQAGLGKSPFRYAGMIGQEIAHGEAVIGNVGGCAVTTKPGGTCDYCGTYIVNMFRVESSDGRSFKVGCECIKKTGDEGLIRLVSKDVAEMKRKRAAEKKLAKVVADRDFCVAERAKGLGRFPHPITHHAADGKTLNDYADWMIGEGYFRSLSVAIKLAFLKEAGASSR